MYFQNFARQEEECGLFCLTLCALFLCFSSNGPTLTILVLSFPSFKCRSSSKFRSLMASRHSLNPRTASLFNF
ncbi:hypothetical protein VNO77_04821 [Canavalia gladiata]|uniref:Uncharacterized protein n=1 Tax=Canavalia gladiata TaxID=3824 RepID=A0AAN9MXY3_CANGL